MGSALCCAYWDTKKTGNYSAQKGFIPAFMKSGHFPWKSKRKASVAVTPCFLQVVM
jgi:hypothetical protein